MMIAIYGERSFALYFSALIQAGDILLPQLKEFDGPKPVLVPVGADQDPHIRLSRDLANKYADSFGFIPPGAIYHKLFRSLGGEVKMSKREPLTMLTLDDKPKEAYRKVMEAFTGGRATVEEQRKLGGEADKCVVYDLYKIHFVEDDDKVKRVYRECLSGERMCGDCKHEIATIVEEDLNRHQQKREEMLDEAKSLLKKGRERLASVRF
jgi:tryptophanyl-tRNA synthetase